MTLPAGLSDPTSERAQSERRVAELLTSKREEILAVWSRRLQALAGSHYQMRSIEELRAWTARGLGATIGSLASGSAAPLAVHADEVSRERAEMGFKIEEVVQGMLLLKEAALPHLMAAYGGDPATAEAAVASLDRRLRILLARFAKLFAERSRRAVLEKAERLAALEERQRLAHELHDSVTQSLYGVSMYGEAASRRLAARELEATESLLERLRETTLDALRQMRRLIFELRPSVLEQRGLVAALEARLATVEGRTGLATELRAAGIGRLPRRLEQGLYGITQEALNNALKHARAGRIVVELGRQGANLVLRVSDDGAGFERAAGGRLGGLGIVGMKERAADLGGKVTITSRPGHGTRVRAVIPAVQPDRSQGER